ncbi:unnamed protein product [Boreogadus saida]
MCPVMSWLLCLSLWVSVTAVQLGQGTFYDTIQQQPGTRPGRISIHMIGESTCCRQAMAGGAGIQRRYAHFLKEKDTKTQSDMYSEMGSCHFPNVLLAALCSCAADSEGSVPCSLAPPVGTGMWTGPLAGAHLELPRPCLLQHYPAIWRHSDPTQEGGLSAWRLLTCAH